MKKKKKTASGSMRVAGSPFFVCRRNAGEIMQVSLFKTSFAFFLRKDPARHYTRGLQVGWGRGREFIPDISMIPVADSAQPNMGRRREEIYFRTVNCEMHRSVGGRGEVGGWWQKS